MSTDWDLRFIDLAKHIATWSKDPSTKVGAVIVRPNRTVAGVGYNGFPRGVHDFEQRLNERPVKYAMIVHAEANAILNCEEPVRGYTLYVTPLLPCSTCAGLIIQSGIKRVVYTTVNDPETAKRWEPSFAVSRLLFHEAGVEVVPYGS